MNYSWPGSSVHGDSPGKNTEWVAMPFSRDLPDPGIEPLSLLSPTLAGSFFTTSAVWEAQSYLPYDPAVPLLGMYLEKTLI